MSGVVGAVYEIVGWSLVGLCLWFRYPVSGVGVGCVNAFEKYTNIIYHGSIIVNIHRSSCKVPVILVTYYYNWNFLDKFSKNTQISNFSEELW